MQSCVIGISLWNGSKPLVQVAKFAPNPPNAGLLKPAVSELKPAPQFGAGDHRAETRKRGDARRERGGLGFTRRAVGFPRPVRPRDEALEAHPAI